MTKKFDRPISGSIINQMNESEQRLLLISNSTLYGRGWLEHVEETFSDFLAGTKQALFVPYALYDHEAFTQRANGFFNGIGISLESVDSLAHIEKDLLKTEAIIVGGGNTFRLLKKLQREDGLILKAIRKAVQSGVPFVGWSAGANVACPTIKTTNDMPIVYPSSFDAINLVPFQINPHYVDPDPNSKHMGETQETRIKEFHEENDIPVIGLREGTWLRVNGRLVALEGATGARVFRKGQTPIEYLPRTKFDLQLNQID